MAGRTPVGASDQSIEDTRWMRLALRLAKRGLGRVAPNPAVGCVLVRGGRVVGRGWTQPGGRPHAETVALNQAGDLAKDATAYVTLEPCSHHGETGPCADALIAAGVARVVGALGDPDPRVDGRGFRRLRAAGVAVTENVLAEAARAVNAGFLARVATNRPVVTLKLAASIDARIATRTGESQWITGPDARRFVHLLRARHDAVMTGMGTVLADDPLLSVRSPGLAHRSPARVVLDSRLRTPETGALAASARDIKSMIITRDDADGNAAEVLRARGFEVIETVSCEAAGVAPEAAVRVLAERGITSVLLESGGTLAASFLRANLVDTVVWFRAPMVIGGDGRAALAALGVEALVDAPRFERIEGRMIGEDVVETYRRRP